jgi:hypothetical protein
VKRIRKEDEAKLEEAGKSLNRGWQEAGKRMREAGRSWRESGDRLQRSWKEAK